MSVTAAIERWRSFIVVVAIATVSKDNSVSAARCETRCFWSYFVRMLQSQSSCTLSRVTTIYVFLSRCKYLHRCNMLYMYVTLCTMQQIWNEISVNAGVLDVDPCDDTKVLHLRYWNPFKVFYSIVCKLVSPASPRFLLFYFIPHGILEPSLRS
jgi:hypothetical protein